LAATPLGTHLFPRMAAPSGSVDRPPRLADYSSLLASAPRAVGECNRCRRCLVHSRMYLVADGEGDMCNLCNHLAAVTNAVATSPISTDDEEEAMELLMKVYMLLRRQRDWARGGQRSAPYAAGEFGMTSAAEQPLPGPDVRGPPESPVPEGSEHGLGTGGREGGVLISPQLDNIVVGSNLVADRMRADLSELDRIAAEPCRESAVRKERRKAREEKNLNKPPKGGKDA
jgi:hypothetical protein